MVWADSTCHVHWQWHAVSRERKVTLQAAVTRVTPFCAATALQNLPPDADKLFLYEKFSPYGAILSVKVRCQWVQGVAANVQSEHPAGSSLLCQSEECVERTPSTALAGNSGTIIQSKTVRG